MFTHKTIHASHVIVLKVAPFQSPAMKMANVIARKGLLVRSVKHVPMATGDSLLMVVRVSVWQCLFT